MRAVVISAMICVVFSGSLGAQDPVPFEMEKVNGFANSKKLDVAVRQFNERFKPEKKLTLAEISQAIQFQLTNTHENNEPEFHKMLDDVIRTSALPKGAIIQVQNFPEESKRDLIFILFNLHLQSYDRVPVPGSKNLWRTVPVRIDFSE